MVQPTLLLSNNELNAERRGDQRRLLIKPTVIGKLFTATVKRTPIPFWARNEWHPVAGVLVVL